jgi:hypothetical protein
MSDLQVAPIKARVIRAVKLDTCGNPVTGTSSAMVVVRGFTQVQVSPDYEEGEEFLTKLADGSACVNQKDAAFLKRMGLEGHFCVLSPDLITVMTGETEILTGSGTVTGTGVMFGTDPLTARFSLELWQPVSGLGACDPATGLPRYVYWAFPNVTNTRLGDFTFELGVFDFVINAETDYTGYLWGDGPGASTWLPAGVTVPQSKHALFNITTTPPPAITAGAVTLV